MPHFIKVGDRGINLDNMLHWQDDNAKGFLITMVSPFSMVFNGVEAEALRWYFGQERYIPNYLDVLEAYQYELELQQLRETQNQRRNKYVQMFLDTTPDATRQEAEKYYDDCEGEVDEENPLAGWSEWWLWRTLQKERQAADLCVNCGHTNAEHYHTTDMFENPKMYCTGTGGDNSKCKCSNLKIYVN
jgi:hypothetical protein